MRGARCFPHLCHGAAKPPINPSQYNLRHDSKRRREIIVFAGREGFYI
jgi:hypothetical protein